MTLAAGSKIRAATLDALLNPRVATTTETADSATTTTTEITVISVTAALVTGRTYRVYASVGLMSTVAADNITTRIREDSATGTTLNYDEIDIDRTSATGNYKAILEAEYTAVASGNKTFVFTIARATGTGDCRMEAGTDHPSYLYVDYIRGI